MTTKLLKLEKKNAIERECSHSQQIVQSLTRHVLQLSCAVRVGGIGKKSPIMCLRWKPAFFERSVLKKVARGVYVPATSSSVELKLPNDGAVRFSATERWRQDMARAANKLNGLVTDRVHQEERRWQEASSGGEGSMHVPGRHPV